MTVCKVHYRASNQFHNIYWYSKWSLIKCEREKFPIFNEKSAYNYWPPLYHNTYNSEPHRKRMKTSQTLNFRDHAPSRERGSIVGKLVNFSRRSKLMPKAKRVVDGCTAYHLPKYLIASWNNRVNRKADFIKVDQSIQHVPDPMWPPKKPPSLSQEDYRSNRNDRQPQSW